MSNNNSQAQSGGIGFLGLLTLIFITLKLTHFINWPWKWVLAPFWIPFAIIGVILLIYGILSLIVHLLKQREYKKRAAANQPKFVSDLDKRR